MQTAQPTATFKLGPAVRKFFLSAFIIFTFVIYAVHERLAGPGPVSAANSLAAAPRPTASAPAAIATTPVLAQATPTDSPPTAAAATEVVQSTPTMYVVTPGDTLDAIAQRFSLSVDEIMAANGITDPNVLMVGQSLVIPVAGSAPPSAVPSSAVPSSAVPPTAEPSSAVPPTAVAPTPSLLPTNPPQAPLPSPTAAGQYRDGQFTGPQADAFYGLVQVQAIIQNGQIADVKFLQYPSDRQTSRRINSIAMPDLTTEAVQAQSANVDIISGATLTSQAFAQSLQAALDSAKP
jgi:uncharacterized protein with FMN-binding domain/LysM repeat protein